MLFNDEGGAVHSFISCVWSVSAACPSCMYVRYLGNSTRLVVTPLTDKIYVTMTQALQLHMGCALSGAFRRCRSVDLSICLPFPKVVL